MGSFFSFFLQKVRGWWATIPPRDRLFWWIYLISTVLLFGVQWWFRYWFPVGAFVTPSIPLPMGLTVPSFDLSVAIRLLFLSPLGLMLASRDRFRSVKTDWQQRPERPLLRLLHCISAASPVGRLVTTLELLVLVPVGFSSNFGTALLGWVGLSLLWLLLLLLVHLQEPVAAVDQLAWGMFAMRGKKLIVIPAAAILSYFGDKAIDKGYAYWEHKDSQAHEDARQARSLATAERNHQFMEHQKTLRTISKGSASDFGHHRALLEAGKLKGSEYLELSKRNDEIRKILIERSSSPTIVPRGGSDLPDNPPK